jgi:predicted nucleic acid-binding Zn finger protein
MNNDSERIQNMVSERRVKLHVFEPSQRKIWTVVGKNNEHWIDPDNIYCSCPGFYFGKLNGKTTCYHLESAHLARKENHVETIIFSDDEFSYFMSGIIADL